MFKFHLFVADGRAGAHASQYPEWGPQTNTSALSRHRLPTGESNRVDELPNDHGVRGEQKSQCAAGDNIRKKWSKNFTTSSSCCLFRKVGSVQQRLYATTACRSCNSTAAVRRSGLESKSGDHGTKPLR